jgi:predicted Zn-dependent protease
MVKRKGEMIGEKGNFLLLRFSPLTLALFAMTTSLFLGFYQVKAEDLPYHLPDLALHSLPISLQKFQGLEGSGDYFEQIKPSQLGYLIWSDFPVKVFVDEPTEDKNSSATALRFHQWTEAVREGIAQWNSYLPLEEVETEETADIIIQYQSPPIETKLNPATGTYDVSPARAAQTRYQFYPKGESPQILYHRMTININPGQSKTSTLAATRHELGHALGIWGHSPVPTDAMYFSQVRDAPTISDRDINTLKKIYQQPTRLGGHFKR